MRGRRELREVREQLKIQNSRIQNSKFTDLATHHAPQRGSNVEGTSTSAHNTPRTNLFPSLLAPRSSSLHLKPCS
ncbi:hypothetical protein [Chroococcidiopsis sp. SAG 2025]|uniref:hypothetical protein n=1 Tax=Chroococcidiopsis sp. SAG 2025 TaxID=171389 RepID=UPI00293744F0|nr:hypothetical protein [Chroococcidiopsis sp. SAG 2025]